jgi:hypothetical protein
VGDSTRTISMRVILASATEAATTIDRTQVSAILILM